MAHPSHLHIKKISSAYVGINVRMMAPNQESGSSRTKKDDKFLEGIFLSLKEHTCGTIHD